jgi:hypothetical protein
MGEGKDDGGGGDGKKWQDTLYIWDGLVTVDDKQKSDDDDGKDSEGVPLSWEGTWVAVEEKDAMKAAAPKRNAFAEYVDSDLKFVVSGKALPSSGVAAGDGEEEGEQWFVAKLTEGDGWDMESDGDGTTKKYSDKVHEVMIKTLKWSGNMFDQTENLLVAKGENEFGRFVSAGWMRPGNRWTLARRYVSDEDDPRAEYTLETLWEAVVDESVEYVEDTGQKKLKIPPWQCSVFHADYTDPPAKAPAAAEEEVEENDDDVDNRGEKRKIDDVADAATEGSPSKEAKQ